MKYCINTRKNISVLKKECKMNYVINKDIENMNESNLAAHHLIYLLRKESLKTVYACSTEYLLVRQTSIHPSKEEQDKLGF